MPEVTGGKEGIYTAARRYLLRHVGVGGQPWIEAARILSVEFGIELPIRRIGLRCEYDDVVGEWEKVREIGDGGALLVRPDRYISWRSIGAVADPACELRRALETALGLDRDTVKAQSEKHVAILLADSITY